MSGPPDILCLGEPLVEFVRVDGEDGPVYRPGFGGDTSNAAIAAARQGASVGYVTQLGADRFGQSILDLWAKEGVDAAAVRRHPSAPTGIYFVDPDPAGQFFTYYRAGSAASLLAPDDLPVDDLIACRILHLSGITLAVSETLRDSAFAAMRLATDGGATVSLDTNLRRKLWPIEVAREVTMRAARVAGIVFTSLEDSQALTGLDDPDKIIDHYRTLGAATVLVSRGADGCRLATGDLRLTIPPAPADPVDSTGAGDSFAGSYLAYWLETGDPERAARRAAWVAARTVSGYGAVAPIPHRSEVLVAVPGA